jgi:hypothetical protein
MESEKPTKSIVEKGHVFLLLFIGLLAVVIVSQGDFPVGTRCSILRSTYGLKDLDKAYANWDKAQKANDELGLAELGQHDVAVLLPFGTSCLVIDTDFFTHFIGYRQVRVLSDPYLGKAFWVKQSDLNKSSPTSPTPPRPETCHDPNEWRGPSGDWQDCFCKKGYKRDATTLKCVPE